MMTQSQNDSFDAKESSIAVLGILFSRSVRSSFASFTLAPISWSEQKDPSAKDPPFLVRLQFMDSIKELRSFCRRQYKIGDKIDFLSTHNGRWEQSPSNEKTGSATTETSDKSNEVSESSSSPSWSQQPRWVVDLSSVSDAANSVVVRESQLWSMKECQQHQLKYISHGKQSKRKQDEPSTKKQKRNDQNAMDINGSSALKNSNRNDDSANNHHGGGKEKRLQAQELVSFFINMVEKKLNEREQTTLEQRIKHQESIRGWFNRADGVLDVAGGCGHVSMALGMEGISSTVVDARASVGKLPRRDRKIWKKAMRPKQVNIDPTLVKYDYCQPVLPTPTVVPFQSQQAWFGSKPDGYDASFRHPDEDDIPVLVATAAAPKNDCSSTIERDSYDQTEGKIVDNTMSDSAILRKSVSALVALHPDEATGEIVQQAVKHRIPFCIVPCCVFARLFPDRTLQDGKPVSSYEDLLDFLQEQDPSIQRTQLSFGGKNIALWSVFPEG